MTRGNTRNAGSRQHTYLNGPCVSLSSGSSSFVAFLTSTHVAVNTRVNICVHVRHSYMQCNNVKNCLGFYAIINAWIHVHQLRMVALYLPLSDLWPVPWHRAHATLPAPWHDSQQVHCTIIMMQRVSRRRIHTWLAGCFNARKIYVHTCTCTCACTCDVLENHGVELRETLACIAHRVPTFMASGQETKT